MQWIELSISTGQTMLALTVSVLNQYGQGGAAVEEWQSEDNEAVFVVKAYLPNSRTYKVQKREIDQSLSKISKALLVEEKRLKPDDWFNSLKNNSAF
jgi:ribosomal protein L11 methylase PrmA